MTFAQVIAVVVYFGTPLVWQMVVALALWALQAGVFFYAVLSCVSGHCNPPPLPEIFVTALVVGSFLGILAMFVLSALQHRLP